MRQSQSKKGVSPLIATILLIAFAVALGSVVMNWGLSLSKENLKDGCKGVEIELVPLNSGNDVCYGSSGEKGYLSVVMQNAGSKDLTGLNILITGEKKSELLDVGQLSIAKGSSVEWKAQQLTYNANSLGKIVQVELIPKTIHDGSPITCTKKAVEPLKISVC